MSGGPAQTPGFWIKTPGGGMFSADCCSALMACGIDPGAFGTYDEIGDAQSAARQEYRDHITEQQEAEDARAADPLDPKSVHGAENQHHSNCNKGRPWATQGTPCLCHRSPRAREFNEQNSEPGTWLSANSQSGHLGQNATHQQSGGRNDPCRNVPPQNFNDPNAGSSLGFSTSQAPCMHHHGISTNNGEAHGDITQVVEGGWAEDMRAAGVTRPDEGNMREQVRRSARAAVDIDRTPETDANGNLTAAGARQETLNIEQQRQAARARGDDVADRELGEISPQEGDPPSGVSGPSADDADKDLAADCIVAHWESKMEDMRLDAINNSEVANSAAAQDAMAEHGVDNFSDLPQSAQQEVVQTATDDSGRRIIDNPPPAQPRMTEAPPAGRGVEPAGGDRGSPRNTPPTPQNCRDFQGNHLAWQMANGDGGAPPWEGRTPTGTTNSPSTASGLPATGGPISHPSQPHG